MTMRRATPVSAKEMGAGVAAAVLLGIAANASALSADPQWRQPFGVFGASANEVIGDFDGDGVPEIAVLLPDISMNNIVSGLGVGILGVDIATGWRWKDIALMRGNLWPRAWVVRQPPQADALLIVRERWMPPNDTYVTCEILGGVPLRHLRTLPNCGSLSILLVVDLDGDGTPDVLERTRAPAPATDTMLRAWRLETGETLWTAPDAWTASAVQLDADAAAEIVVSEFQGRVLDGATGMDEWSYAAGFGTSLAGNFDNDPGTVEFLSFDGLEGRVTFFRTAPWSPTHDLQLYPSPERVHAADLGDGTDVLVLDNGSSFDVLDTLAGTRRPLAPSGFYNAQSSSVGPIGEDGEPALFANSYRNGDHAAIIDLASGEELHRDRELAAPDHALVHVPEAANHPAALAYVTIRNNGQPRLHVVDPESGEMLVQRATVLVAPMYGNMPPPIAAADFDADGTAEILVGGYVEGTWRLTAFDAVTLQARWSRDASTLPALANGIVAIDVADVDGDDALEIVLLTGGRLSVLDHRALVAEWEQPLPGFALDLLRIHDTDGDGIPEIVVSDVERLVAFDAATRSQAWVLDAFTMWSGRFAFIEREGECHIALFSFVDPYRELRCSDWTPVVQSPGQLDVNWVGPRLPDGVIAIRDGTFGILDAAAGRFTPATRFLGPNLGDIASMVVPLAVTATTAEYAVAHDGVVERVRVASTRLFSDTFDTRAPQP